MPEHADFALRASQQWAAVLPDLNVTVDELTAWIRLSRVFALQQRIDDRSLREFEARGVRGSDDFRTLALLRRSPTGLTNGELLQNLGGSKAGMSARLSRFTTQGITERTPSAVDRRSHTNTLTTLGIELSDQLVTAVVAARRALTASLSPAQVETFANILAQMIESLDPDG